MQEVCEGGGGIALPPPLQGSWPQEPGGLTAPWYLTEHMSPASHLPSTCPLRTYFSRARLEDRGLASLYPCLAMESWDVGWKCISRLPESGTGFQNFPSCLCLDH